MLVIKPIQEKKLQKELAEQCGGIYYENALSYIAMDCDDDGETLKSVLGICQFSFWDGEASIHQLTCLPNIKDDEALMIMARTAMSFLFRCGIQNLTVSEQNVDADLLKKLSFRKTEDGIYSIDLKKFYISPCHFQQDTPEA